MKRPIDETMGEARQFFIDRAQEVGGDERIASVHLREMAEAIQENSRVLEVLRKEIAELHHLVGVR